MKVLGVDPGYERLGLAVLEKKGGREAVLYSSCFKTGSDLEFSERLLLISKEVKELIKNFQPDVLAVETLYLGTNQKTAMRVSEVRGVVINEGKSGGLRIFEASPPAIKLAVTGSGRADKAQIKKMLKMLVKIDEAIISDDELDSIAIALTAFSYIRSERVIHIK
ncbi:MAG: crossover junction endodeoxyribonuclease RuvC [Patescibacteria group bacterium]